MMSQPATRPNRQSCDIPRLCTTPRGRCLRFRAWSGYPLIAAPRGSTPGTLNSRASNKHDLVDVGVRPADCCASLSFCRKRIREPKRRRKLTCAPFFPPHSASLERKRSLLPKSSWLRLRAHRRSSSLSAGPHSCQRAQKSYRCRATGRAFANRMNRSTLR